MDFLEVRREMKLQWQNFFDKNFDDTINGYKSSMKKESKDWLLSQRDWMKTQLFANNPQKTSTTTTEK